MRHCPSCSFPIDRHNLPALCPKHDEEPVRAKARKPLVIDLAHRGETVAQALAKLDKAVSECVWHGHSSLKVIHGHGSGGGASRIKPQVLAALRKHAERLDAVVEQ
jgi:dsDNA-specific endonuclease/ATPase MutS2